METMQDANNVVSLGERRKASIQPDPEFVRTDEDGRQLFRYTLSYQLGKGMRMIQIWAFDQADVEMHMQAMRETLACEGQVYRCVQA